VSSLRRLLVLLALAVGLSVLAAAPVQAQGTDPPCPRLVDYDPAAFTQSTTIDNEFLPLVPGTQMVLEGRASRTGEPLPHRVTFTATDLVKVIDGVRTRVMWDVDEQDGELAEAELAFFAQDDDENVWNLGEYPEEFENGEFVGAPSTWITGQDGAKAGIHMPARRGVSSRLYVQGFAPEIDFLDCARIVDRHEQICVPAGCFDDVTITHETNALVPEDGIQSKYHAPRVGIIQIGSVEPATGETLALTAREELDESEMREVREEALRLDRRGYRFGGDAYQATGRARQLGD
jgi:hypothetical protein